MSDSPRRNSRSSGAHGQPRANQGDGPSRQSPARGKNGPRLWLKEGAPARGDVSAREPEEVFRAETRSVRPRHDDPPIPDSVTSADLDRTARNELKTLSKENAEQVARHLAMASQLIESDPHTAHQHAISAVRRAGRIGIARETLAITAYMTGDYALALRELRTYRRITGRDDQLPMMVDSERGLERPEKALELGRSVRRDTLPVAVQVELAIAMSGARLDLGTPEAALQELRIPQLDPDLAFSWSSRLYRAYATVLEELGRGDEAQEWYARSGIAADAFESDDDDDEAVLIVEEDVDQGYPGE